MIDSVEIIAEIGVNHDGDIAKAHKLVEAAVEAGADTVKTQAFKTELLVSRDALKAPYQARNDRRTLSQFEMLKSLELSLDAQRELKEHVESLGAVFLSTPFDEESLRMLVEDLGMDRVKIASSDIVSVPLLYSVGAADVRVLLSTGLTEGLDIDLGLSALSAGYLSRSLSEVTPPTCKGLAQEPESQRYLQERVTLLHCVSSYPAPIQDLNLRVIDVLRSTYGLPVGYSDHSDGTLAAVVATARGARVIEKHLTLSKGSNGPDHQASLEPNEFAHFSTQIRQTIQALGNGRRELSPGEVDNRLSARKQVIATREIHPGEILGVHNLGIQRPCAGIPASEYATLLGTFSASHYQAGDAIGR